LAKSRKKKKTLRGLIRGEVNFVRHQKAKGKQKKKQKETKKNNEQLQH